MIGSGFSLIATVIGFAMSAAFVFFVCARLIIRRIRSSGMNAPAFEIEFRSNPELREHEIHGLDPILVAAIPTMKYCREAFCSKEDAQCSICLGEYQEKEVIRVMPTCLHNYHLACIDVWLEKHSTCPICRLSLNTNEARLASPFVSSGLPFHGAEFSNDHSLAWLLPFHQHSGNSRRNQEMLESVSVVTGIPHEEHGSCT